MGKPMHVKPSWYAINFEPLKEIALKYGYNLVLHGSLNRDMDLIAIPWAAELVGTVADMIVEMSVFIGGYVLYEDDVGHIAFRDMYHGRINYVININRGGKKTDYADSMWYLDISVTPAK